MNSSQGSPTKSLKVAFINGPHLKDFSRSQRSPGVIKSGTMYYPYWLAHAAAVLDKLGFDIQLYDCPAEGWDHTTLLGKLNQFSPHLCVVETSTASIESELFTAAQIKERLPSQVCLTGTHATALWNEILSENKFIDYVAIGEYDYTIRDLAQLLEKHLRIKGPSTSSTKENQNPGSLFSPSESELEALPGLGFRLGNRILRGPVRAPIENVDDLPWIAPIYKRFLNIKNYYFSIASYPMVMLIGGRGCVAKCTYCVYPQVMHGHHYRTRSPDSIVQEMLWIQNEMPEVQEIVFEDDTFTGDRAYATKIAELVKLYGVKLKWFANVRTTTDRETLAAMKEAGFRCCAVGFESGDNVLLKNMWKGQTVDLQERFMKNCRELGILVHGCFMVGFPGESKETMDKTLNLALRLNPDSAQFYPVMPFPGTAYYQWAKEKGYLATEKFSEWLNPEGGHQCVINLPGLSAQEIEKFCERAVRRFHFQPRYIVKKIFQLFTQPREGIRSLRSFFYFFYYLIFNRRNRFRSQLASLSKKIEMPAEWYKVHQPPKGRMYLQEEEIKKAAGDFESIAKRQPKL